MKVKVQNVNFEDLLKKMKKREIKLKLNLHIIEGTGTREVDMISRSPKLGEIARVKVKVVDKVKKITSAHNQVTQAGAYYFLNTISGALRQSTAVSSGSYSGQLIIILNSGVNVNLAVTGIPQVISPTTGIIYYIATYTPGSTVTISQLKLYISFAYATVGTGCPNVNFGCASGTYTSYVTYYGPVIFAELNLSLTLNSSSIYSFLWEIQIINNYTNPQQYNTITWLVFMFYNNTGYYPVVQNGILVITSAGTSNTYCGQNYSTIGVSKVNGFVYISGNGQPYFILLTLFNNPISSSSEIGYINGILVTNLGLIAVNLSCSACAPPNQAFLGCGLEIFGNFNIQIPAPSSSEPVITFLEAITVTS
ncbi:hypothetical protein SFV1gp42 [Sulfolobus filamentous virus 1]|uniref:Uncharacterized protein n=2 Tax=Alphalipothrixvirus beppuense TaxID=2734584 RepID=A0A346LU81_SUFV1|nr:hypothetical protein HOT91_gp42 [Sulfolobus filamentous virus 1]AXQ00124.1 hypothetical protein SFV1gp42 [Sulfolobus filamentous virus 1]AZI75744.1 hypothetical protein SBFV1_gp43 [Sulfolobales Beppu filamentous phage 1]